MNNLIMKGESLTMSSREIAKLTDKRHDNVMRDIVIMLDSLGYPLLKYEDTYKHEQNKQNYTMYVLPKDETICLLTGYNAKARMNVIKRWQELEEKQSFKIPQTYSAALLLAGQQAEQLEIQNNQLELQAPKVAFVDNCVERGQLMTATQVAQKHKMSAVKLNRFLDELGGVYSKSVKRSRAFIQSFIDNGHGEMKQTEQGYSQALFTASGEQFINEKLITEGVV